MTRFLLNGRFLSRAQTGVDRVSLELARELSRHPKVVGKLDVAVPKNAPPDHEIRERLGLGPEGRIFRGVMSGYPWEQLELAFRAPKSLLLSLANMGPALRKAQTIMIHDTQVFDRPEAYKRAFRSVYRFLQPHLGRRARFLLTVSEHSARSLERHGIDASRKAQVVHNGVDHFDRIASDANALEKFQLRSGGYFLAVGSLAAHKNLPFLIDLFSSSAGPNLPLAVVGDSNARVFGAQNLEQGDRVLVLGRVTDAELKSLYKNARAFLFPSITEGFGLPALEAMSCGCPVVASNGGAIPEACGDAALYCDPQDKAAWLAAIARLEGDGTLRAAMSDTALARSRQFTWAIAAEKLVSIMT